MKERLLSMILVVCFFLGAMPTAVFAETSTVSDSAVVEAGFAKTSTEQLIKTPEECNAVNLSNGETVTETVCERVGAFTVTGGVLNTDFKFEDNTLTICTNTPLTVENNDKNSATDNIIVIKSKNGANVTLAGVNVNVLDKEETAAFEIAEETKAKVTLTLKRNTVNTFKSGTKCAGIQKNSADIHLVINGWGTLNAHGGVRGAGIGGGNSKLASASNITIQNGIINAYGGEYGAAIGAADLADADNITISGGTILAIAGETGPAGIGGGPGGCAYNIKISGGNIIAKGQNSNEAKRTCGPAIGAGGSFFDSSYYQPTASGIYISGGIINASATGYKTAAIGGGCMSHASDIIITGGCVFAKGTGTYGVDIGGGTGGGTSNIVITNASVKATTSIQPTDGKGNNTYFFELYNPYYEPIYIDGEMFPYFGDGGHNGDPYVYPYLVGETHTVKVGDIVTHYHFGDNKFTEANYLSTYSHDSDGHWHPCAQENCTEKTNYENHRGGIATCTEKEVCEVCGASYGSIDSKNHTGNLVWTQNSFSDHRKKWSCCNELTDESGLHTFSEGICTVCGYTAKAGVTVNGTLTYYETLAAAYKALPESDGTLTVFGDCTDENVNYSADTYGFLGLGKNCSVTVAPKGKLGSVLTVEDWFCKRPHIEFTNNGHVDKISVYPNDHLTIMNATGTYALVSGEGVKICNLLPKNSAFQDSSGNIINAIVLSQATNVKVVSHETHSYITGICACGDEGHNTVLFKTSGITPDFSKSDVKWNDKILDGVKAPLRTDCAFECWEYNGKAVTADTTFLDIAENYDCTDIKLQAKWICYTADSGILWEAFRDDAVSKIKLASDIHLDKRIDISGIKALNLNGFVLDAQITLHDTILTVTDSRPDNAHGDSTIPCGGVISGKMSLEGTKPSSSVLNANGGTVTAQVTGSQFSEITSTKTPTVFTRELSTNGSISGGDFRENVSVRRLHNGALSPFVNGGIFYKTLYTDSFVTVANRIFFTVDGETHALEIVQNKKKAYTPLPPTKDGYTFCGYWQDSQKNTWDFETATLTDNDIYLYADFLNNTYKVNFYLNGKDGIYYTQNDFIYDVENSLTPCSTSRNGYVFVGWNTIPDGSGEAFADGAKVKNLTSENHGTVNLFAQWEPLTVSGTVKSFGNGNAKAELFKKGSSKADYSCYCNSSGEFSVSNVTVGSYTLKISKEDHTTREYVLNVENEHITADYEIFPSGDINKDGVIDVLDIAETERIINSGKTVEGYDFKIADINSDGEIDIFDYSAIVNTALL